MYIPEKLKNNRYRTVVIPKRSDVFARFGFQVPGDQLFSGDDVFIPEASRKTDILADMDAYDQMMSREEAAAARKAAASKQVDGAE